MKTDKLKHFIAGTYIALIFSIPNNFIPPFIVVAIFAAAKEIWDWLFGANRTFSWPDFIATIGGGFWASLIIYPIKYP
jgi:hypothetical protein